jgi:hypothetical protein
MKLTDLQLVVQIIDLASEKGVFKGADLKTVGEVRERIIEFVKANAQPVEGNTQPAVEGAPVNEPNTETK